MNKQQNFKKGYRPLLFMAGVDVKSGSSVLTVIRKGKIKEVVVKF